jgi:cytochrome c553
MPIRRTLIEAMTKAARQTTPLLIAALAWIGAPQLASADDAKLKAYGQHLARECTSCHRLDGVHNSIPSIIGWPIDTFIATMKFYRDGARTNPVMVSVANSLTDEQLRALAVFFASVPKPAKKTSPAERKATK